MWFHSYVKSNNKNALTNKRTNSQVQRSGYWLPEGKGLAVGKNSYRRKAALWWMATRLVTVTPWHYTQAPNQNAVCAVLCSVPQSCPTLWDPWDCSPPGSSVHGVFQARILERVAIFFYHGSSWPRDWTQVSCIAGRCFSAETSWLEYLLNSFVLGTLLGSEYMLANKIFLLRNDTCITDKYELLLWKIWKRF